MSAGTTDQGSGSLWKCQLFNTEGMTEVEKSVFCTPPVTPLFEQRCQNQQVEDSGTGPYVWQVLSNRILARCSGTDLPWRALRPGDRVVQHNICPGGNNLSAMCLPVPQ